MQQFQSNTVTGSTALGETLSITGNDPNITFVDSNNNPALKFLQMEVLLMLLIQQIVQIDL